MWKHRTEVATEKNRHKAPMKETVKVTIENKNNTILVMNEVGKQWMYEIKAPAADASDTAGIAQEIARMITGTIAAYANRKDLISIENTLTLKTK